MISIEDAFELAAKGIYGDVPSVTAEIDAFLQRHLAPRK
jgi:hypothetical protein